MGTEFWIQMIVYGVSFGTAVGAFTTKLKYIEAKLDKHNQLVERTYLLEKDVALIKQDAESKE